MEAAQLALENWYGRERGPRPFLMPPSPFEAEKGKLGGGFLREPHPRNRAADRLHPVQRVRHKGRFRILTEAQREYIGSTGREVPRKEVAEQFGIKVTYVDKLRNEYRRRMDAKKGTGEAAGPLQAGDDG